MKKILFLINTLEGGGAERVLIDLVNNLDKSEFCVTLMTLTDRGVHREKLLPHIIYRSINKFKNTFLQKIFAYAIYNIIPPKLIYKFFIKEKYDYEIAYLEGLPTKILYYSSNKKARKLAWVHTDLYQYFNGHERLFRNIKDYIQCYRAYDTIICVSTAAKCGFEKRFGFTDNVIVLNNAVDKEAIINLAKENADDIQLNGRFIIISIGRLIKVKGFDRLLRVHERLITEGLVHDLWILGEGEERESPEDFIETHHLSATVKLLGFKKNPYKYLKIADLFVCPSRVEGLGTVIIEALALRKPVLSTACLGCDDLLGDSQFGLVVKNDEEGIYQGLRSFLMRKEVLNYYIKQADMKSAQMSLKPWIASVEELLR